MNETNNQTETNNSVFLMGAITKSPELRETSKGPALCQFTVVTEDHYEAKDGTNKTMNNYHLVKAWGKMAIVCNKNYREGSKVKLKGKLKTSSYLKGSQKVYQTSVELLQIKPQ